MISSVEVRKRLIAVLQLRGMGGDWQRTAESALNAVVPEILKIIKEEVSKKEKECRTTS